MRLRRLCRSHPMPTLGGVAGKPSVSPDPAAR